MELSDEQVRQVKLLIKQQLREDAMAMCRMATNLPPEIKRILPRGAAPFVPTVAAAVEQLIWNYSRAK